MGARDAKVSRLSVLDLREAVSNGRDSESEKLPKRRRLCRWDASRANVSVGVQPALVRVSSLAITFGRHQISAEVEVSD